jgi:hypothetical protein
MYMYYMCGFNERHYFYYYKINVRENRRGNQQWTIQTLVTLGTQDTARRQAKQKVQHSTEN